MFTIRNLSKAAIFSVFLVLSASAMSDDQKLQGALGTITSQDMASVSEQDYTNAWADLKLLVKKGFALSEATKIISATVDRYKNQWEKVGLGAFFAPFDVKCSRGAVIDLAICCVKQGFYCDGAIEFIKAVQDVVMSEECADLVTSLLDVGQGLGELEQIAQEGLRACTIESIRLGLLIYQGLVKKELFLEEALLAVKQTISHCDDEIFKIYSNACIIEPAFEVLVVLAFKGHFLNDAFAIASRFLNDVDKEPNDIMADLLMSIAYHNSYAPKILQLMQQSLASNDAEVYKCVLCAMSSCVAIKGQWIEQLYQVATQALAQNDVGVRCAAIYNFSSLVYYDICTSQAIALMHMAEKDENEKVRDVACDLRCFLAARGNIIEETAALARNKGTSNEDALVLYQALVQSGHCLDEALRKALLVTQQADGKVLGVLSLFASLFLHGYNVLDVKQCAMEYMKKLDDNYNYADELGGLAPIRVFACQKFSSFTLKSIENEESLFNSDSACQIFFNALFTSPDLAHAKESCEKALRQADIDPTIFTDTFF